MTERVGGWLFSSANLEDGETLLKMGLGLHVVEGRRVYWGRLYLTDRRLIWLPQKRFLQIMSGLPWAVQKHGKPLIVPLAEVHAVEVGAIVRSGVPPGRVLSRFGRSLVIEHGSTQNEFYIPPPYPLIRGRSEEWKQAVEQALATSRL